MPAVNLQTVWKFAWNAVEFVFHHEAMTVLKQLEFLFGFYLS